MAFWQWFLNGVLVVFSALFFLFSWEFNPTAALFPRLIAGTTFVFVLISLATDLVTRKKKGSSAADESAATATTAWYIVLGVQALYIGFIVLLGFSTATFVFLVILPVLMHYRRWIVVCVHSLLLTLAVAGSFVLFFHARLPKGVLWTLWQ